MDFRKVQELLLKNDQYAEAFDEMSVSFHIAKIVIQARAQRNLTQKELAVLVDTGQSSIARLESGEGLPSLSFLQKVAKALHMAILPPLFIPEEEIKYWASSSSDVAQLKMKIVEIREALASNPKKTFDMSTISGNSQEEVTGGDLY
ncbi:MAG: helix-turn-helix transcriptional regulator [Patescibacteria group bacterium]|nr:helix-turn-helix transcriptional regulator [Patescibacteria group bacterium]